MSIFCDALIAVAGVWLLLLPAIWNRFPLIFYDTGPYLELGFAPHFMPHRSIFYGLFLRAAGVGWNPWLAGIWQALLTLWILAQLQRAFLGRVSRLLYLGMVLILTVCTSLPWYVGQWMPDLFGPLMVIALYLLGFHSRKLNWLQRCGLIGTVLLAVISHSSFLPLAVGLLPILVLARWLIHTPAQKPELWLASSAIAAGVAVTLLTNFLYTHELFLSRSGSTFFAARMMEDGLISRLLDDTCPDSGYRLCSLRDRLPRDANEWLWAPKSPFQQLGAFDGMHEESSRLVAGTLRRYPLAELRAAAHAAWTQFFYLRTGAESLEVRQGIGIQHMIDEVAPVLARRLPDQVGNYLAARQQRKELALWRFNEIHVRAAHASLLGVVLLLAACLYLRRWLELDLLIWILWSLVVNAAICGIVSGPLDRYQTRMIWLAPLGLLLVTASATAGRATTFGEQGNRLGESSQGAREPDNG